MNTKLQTVLFFLCLQLICSLNSLKKTTIPKFCWRDAYKRKGPKISLCPKGTEKVGLFCYKNCPAGMKRFGIDCHSVCPEGLRDDGLFCRKAEYGRGAGFPWKFRDGLKNPDKGMFQRCEKANGVGNCEKYGAIVYPKCKEGYESFGCCICRPKQKPNCAKYDLIQGLDLSCGKKIQLGKRVERTCLEGEEKQFGVCYDKCEDDYYGFGKLCIKEVPQGYSRCGIGASINKEFCAEFIKKNTYSAIYNLVDTVFFGIERTDKANYEIYKKIKAQQKELKELKNNLKEIDSEDSLYEFLDKVEDFINDAKYDDTAVDEIIMSATDFITYIDDKIVSAHKKFLSYGVCSSDYDLY